MTKSTLAWLTVSLAIGLGPAAAAWPKSPVDYPRTRRVDVVENYHGTQVSDPYRWLEEDVRASPEVAEWVDRQNLSTRAYLDAIAARPEIVSRLTELWNYPRYGVPSPAGSKYLWTRNDGLQNQSVLCIGTSYRSPGEVLLDPNSWSQDGTVALLGISASDDGKYLAYKKSEAGSDWQTIHLVDLESRAALPEELKWVRFSAIEWNSDSSGFYYNRYPEPDSEEEHQGLALNQMVYFHRVGTPQSEDQLVYRRADHPDWHFWVGPTEDGRYLVLMIEKSTDAKNQLYCRDLSRPDSDWHPLIEDFADQFSFIGSDADRFYLLTDFEAPARRIVAMDLSRPGRDGLREIVPEGKATLENATVIAGRLVASYLADVTTQVRLYSLAGDLQKELELPGLGTVEGFRGKATDAETFYAYTSYNTPARIYRYDFESGETELVRQPETRFDPQEFVVRQVFYPSKDGTRIPMFLAHRKGLAMDGENPTLLYGYGGFSISITPSYSPSWVVWMERGGVVAVANLRGGGEYGEQWHLAGKLEKKQNVFDDFIAAAEWLGQEKVTRPGKLAIQGGSNGGLLVGAVMCQRPELFGACLPAVGVMDMLRFHRFTAGRFWTAEFGSADDPQQFAYLLAYSPYHNLEPGTHYPATLITTADTDDRVVPMHSFKFAAAPQHAQQGDAPVLIRIETRAGHGAGTPTSKKIEQAADTLAFLVSALERIRARRAAG